MQWIRYLKTTNAPFKVYKLNPQDSIILESKIDDSNQLVIILEGLVYLVKVFTNKEIKSVSLLSKNRIIKIESIDNNNKNYHYMAVAICNTNILSIHLRKIINKTFITNKLLQTINIFYNYTLKEYENMTNVLSQKNIKIRIILLLFIISEKFGRINNYSIVIPIYISHKMLSHVLETSRVTITRALNEMHKDNIITYNSKYIEIHDFIEPCIN